MKNLRKFCATMALALALALSTFAGEMSTPGATSPPPPPQAISETGGPGTPVVGEMSTPGATELDPVTSLTLSLLESVLLLF